MTFLLNRSRRRRRALEAPFVMITVAGVACGGNDDSDGVTGASINPPLDTGTYTGTTTGTSTTTDNSTTYQTGNPPLDTGTYTGTTGGTDTDGSDTGTDGSSTGTGTGSDGTGSSSGSETTG